MLVALPGQIIVIVDPSVLVFEGMIQWFEVTATGTNVCGAWHTDREHCSPMAWSFLAYRTVIHGGGLMRDWDGAFILQNSPVAC